MREWDSRKERLPVGCVWGAVGVFGAKCAWAHTYGKAGRGRVEVAACCALSAVLSAVLLRGTRRQCLVAHDGGELRFALAGLCNARYCPLILGGMRMMGRFGGRRTWGLQCRCGQGATPSRGVCRSLNGFIIKPLGQIVHRACKVWIK